MSARGEALRSWLAAAGFGAAAILWGIFLLRSPPWWDFGFFRRETAGRLQKSNGRIAVAVGTVFLAVGLIGFLVRFFLGS